METDDAADAGERLALVLSGGGSKGALQVGCWRAMQELGLRPDLIVGASVGALNGALIAAGRSVDGMAEGWRALQRGDLFGFNWSLLWKGLRAESLFSARRFREFLERTLPDGDLEDLEIPLHVVTTHLSAGEACVWSEGSLIDAVRASTAIPGLLPPVPGHGGVPHIDGSLGDNLPVEAARGLGATRIVAVDCRTCDRCHDPGTSIADVMGRAFGIAADCTLRRSEAALEDGDRVLLLQPDLGEHVYALDFSQGDRLVGSAYEYARSRLESWLGTGTAGPARG